jgi:FtsP/CotA-like multicopper oxidase with cupredoxin domain
VAATLRLPVLHDVHGGDHPFKDESEYVVVRWRIACLVIVPLVLLLVCVPVIAGVGLWLYRQGGESNVGTASLETPLQIPDLLEPSVDASGRKVFNLEFVEGRTELIPGKMTPTWGLNQSYLSPTLRASEGDEVVVNVTNSVGEETTLHWHGMHLPARMDGGPHQMIGPGETWSPNWKINQPAATLWFHPHLHGKTAEHVYRGAAGMFLIDDDESEGLALPDTYGVDDIPLIVQDKRFSSDGSLDMDGDFFRFMDDVGTLGDEILVNGTYSPVFEATTELVRFRILNASNARVYNFGFTDSREFHAVATDSGLLAAPVGLARLQLSPGERAEIVVRVQPGDDVILRSYPPSLGSNVIQERFNGGDDTFDVLRVRAAGGISPSRPLPERLATIDRPDRDEAIETREFRLSGMSTINGESMDMERIDAVVLLDSTEIWEVTNGGGAYHNFHVHLVHFLILDIDGGEPPEHMRGWKDTVFLPEGSTVRIIARFEEHADPNVPYMFHCHILMHEDAGMMGQFVVIEPGTTPPDRIRLDGEGHRH